MKKFSFTFLLSILLIISSLGIGGTSAQANYNEIFTSTDEYGDVRIISGIDKGEVGHEDILFEVNIRSLKDYTGSEYTVDLSSMSVIGNTSNLAKNTQTITKPGKYFLRLAKEDLMHYKYIGLVVKLDIKKNGKPYTFRHLYSEPVINRQLIDQRDSWTAEPDPGRTFPDVKADDYFYQSALNLGRRGVMVGTLVWNTEYFFPQALVSRGEAAQILSNVLELDTKNFSEQLFSDLPRGSEFYGPATALAQAGIINGHTDGTFKPWQLLTRAQLAVMLTKAFDLKMQPQAQNPFVDVPNTSVYAPYIKTLVHHKLVAGTTPTTFSPNNLLNRGDFATFIDRTERLQK